MFNSYGWIQLGMNRKGTDIMNEEIQIKYDKLDIELDEKAKSDFKKSKIQMKLLGSILSEG